MVFSSLVFLNIFLPIFLFLYFLSVGKLKKNKLNNLVLLLASSIFYAWGAPKILPLLVISSLIDYLASKKFSKSSSKQKSKPWLIFALGVNILSLLYYKYTGFFLESLSQLSLLGTASINPQYLNIILPIGISFFTFQKISYLLDIWQERAEPPKSFLDYLLFVICFPQLIAGPIVRFHSVSEQIRNREHSQNKTFLGFHRFFIGLAKKVLIANELGAISDQIFTSNLDTLPTEYAWFGIICYSMQIYFDFSGYSDMAIGLGLILGFKFPENFNHPYISQNISEFWRRWHITLSEWMKLYLYIPLGGNRNGAARTYLNLWLVFLISGLWHGASWNFIAWGAFHGLFLVLDRLFLIEITAFFPKAIKIFLNFIIVLFSWVLFRAENLSEALVYWKRMLAINSTPLFEQNMLWADILSGRGIFVLLTALGLSFGPAFSKINLSSTTSWKPWFKSASLTGLTSTACLILCLLSLVSSHFNPFIYFRF